jgi:hypothetical protein
LWITWLTQQKVQILITLTCVENLMGLQCNRFKPQRFWVTLLTQNKIPHLTASCHPYYGGTEPVYVGRWQQHGLIECIESLRFFQLTFPPIGRASLTPLPKRHLSARSRSKDPPKPQIRRVRKSGDPASEFDVDTPCFNKIKRLPR